MSAPSGASSSGDAHGTSSLLSSSAPPPHAAADTKIPSSQTSLSPLVSPLTTVHTEVQYVDGAAVWVLRGFSKLDDKPGFCMFSPEFFMAGTWWKMQLFPSGGGRTDAASSEGHVSLYLFATRAPTKAKYSLSLHKARASPPSPTSTSVSTSAATGIDADDHISERLARIGGRIERPGASGGGGGGSGGGGDDENGRAAAASDVLYACHGSTKSFSSAAEGWGFLKFYSRRQLTLGAWAARDEIRLEANVSVVTGVRHTADPRHPADTRLASVVRFQHDMTHLLESATDGDGDLEFVVSAGARDLATATVCAAHRNILRARSAYFRIMLAADMDEARTGRVFVDHCRPSVFRQLLCYLYTGACDLSGVGAEPPTAGETASVRALDEGDAEVRDGDGDARDERERSGRRPETDGDGDDDEREQKGATDRVVAQRLRQSEISRERRSRERQQVVVTSGYVGDDAVSDAALELLCAADRFDAADLRNMAEQYLVDTLNCFNCVHRCYMADTIGRLDLLRSMSIKFISGLAVTTRTTPTFTAQLLKLPKPLLVELMSVQSTTQPDVTVCASTITSGATSTAPKPVQTGTSHASAAPISADAAVALHPSSSIRRTDTRATPPPASVSRLISPPPPPTPPPPASSSLHPFSSSALLRSPGAAPLSLAHLPISTSLPSPLPRPPPLVRPSAYGDTLLLPPSSQSLQRFAVPPASASASASRKRGRPEHWSRSSAVPPPSPPSTRANPSFVLTVTSPPTSGGATIAAKIGRAGPVETRGGDTVGGEELEEDVKEGGVNDAKRSRRGSPRRFRTDEIAIMTVAELKEALGERGASKSGRRSTLVQRLIASEARLSTGTPSSSSSTEARH